MSFLYPELSKISASASISAGCQSIFLIIEARTSIRHDSITKHIGADISQTWETLVKYLLISIDTEEIVLENNQPLCDTTAEELRIYRKILKNALAIHIQTLALEILAPCPGCLSLQVLWTYLHSLYYQETGYTFLVQLRKVVLLHQDVSI
jgi:hypothetical protein